MNIAIQKSEALVLKCWVCNKKTEHEDLGWAYRPDRRFKCKICGANNMGDDEDVL